MAENGVERSASSASETASQLLAKILNQLSLSAWLPSGALVLLIGFVMEFGSAIDSHPTPGTAITATLVAIGGTSIGGMLLIALTIVVVTMLTQAFSFGAIRVLEGYWGTTRLMEFLASFRADRHRTLSAQLYVRYQLLRARAIDEVLAEITAQQETLVAAGQPETFTKAMRAVLEARVKAVAEPDDLKISAAQRAASNDYDWTDQADRNLARRELNLLKRLEDYPIDARHVLPTKLGNVLRAHEDATGLNEVEGFVDRVFDDLPFSMQLLHDEQRTRLDLYCSMVFVLVTAAVVATARFGLHHWRYQLAAAVLAWSGTWGVYRAAISSARYYGAVLEAIVMYTSNKPGAAPRRSERIRRLLGLTT